MSARTRLLGALLTIAAIAAVGIVEAARSDHVGLLGVLVIIEVLTVAIVGSLRSISPVMVRTDLITWLDDASAVTGESPSALADRALSAYRAALSDDPGS